jgi:hypothetical protein
VNGQRPRLFVTNIFFSTQHNGTFDTVFGSFVKHAINSAHGNIFTAPDPAGEWNDNFLFFTISFLEDARHLALEELCRDFMRCFVDRLQSLTPQYTWKWMAFIHPTTCYSHIHIMARALNQLAVQTTPDKQTLRAVQHLVLDLARSYSI